MYYYNYCLSRDVRYLTFFPGRKKFLSYNFLTNPPFPPFIISGHVQPACLENAFFDYFPFTVLHLLSIPYLLLQKCNLFACAYSRDTTVVGILNAQVATVKISFYTGARGNLRSAGDNIIDNIPCKYANRYYNER